MPHRTFLLRRLSAAVISLASGAATAGIVDGQGNAVPNCPLPGLAALCIVDNVAARVDGPVAPSIESVRIGRTAGYGNGGSLSIPAGQSLTLTRSTLAPSLVVGDNFGTSGQLEVIGSLTINEPLNGGGTGGLMIGPFANPGDAPMGLFGAPIAATTAVIRDGGQVTINKPGGANVAAAMWVGYGVGARSTLLLDGGIGAFGSPALGATLSTQGNLSIGREGEGSLTLLRNATVTAGLVFMSAVSPTGASSLEVGALSTLHASRVIAGIGINPATGAIDRSNPHGTATIGVRSTGTLAGDVWLGPGGTLFGSGNVTGGVLNDGGRLLPGNSPGTLNIGGDLIDNGGRIEIEIGAGGVHDRLLVGGRVQLTGTEIFFRFLDGFAPDAGFTLDFIDSAIDDLSVSDLRLRVGGLADGFQFNVAGNPLGQLVFTALNNGVAIPAPGSAALLLAALLGFGLVRLGPARRSWPSRAPVLRAS